MLSLHHRAPLKMTQSTVNLGETSTPTGRKRVRKSARGEGVCLSLSPLERGHVGTLQEHIFQVPTKIHGHYLGAHPAPGSVPSALLPALPGPPSLAPSWWGPH